ncbi:hypothetical protein SprV_0100419300 [Sparganum proliferum]
MNSSKEMKYKFYEDLNALPVTVWMADILIFLIEFNACTGRDHTAWEGMLSPPPPPLEVSSCMHNGILLLQACAKRNLLLLLPLSYAAEGDADTLSLAALPAVTGKVDRRYPKPGLFLHAVNTSPITTFSLSLSLWTPASVVYSPGADFLTAVDILVDCRPSHLHDTTTDPTVQGISSSNASCQLAALHREVENPFRQLLAKYFDLTRPDFSASIPPHDFVHYIRSTGPPLFSRPHRLAPAHLAAAKVEFEHMLQLGIIRQSERMGLTPPRGPKDHHS